MIDFPQKAGLITPRSFCKAINYDVFNVLLILAVYDVMKDAFLESWRRRKRNRNTVSIFRKMYANV